MVSSNAEGPDGPSLENAPLENVTNHKACLSLHRLLASMQTSWTSFTFPLVYGSPISQRTDPNFRHVSWYRECKSNNIYQIEALFDLINNILVVKKKIWWAAMFLSKIRWKLTFFIRSYSSCPDISSILICDVCWVFVNLFLKKVLL